MGLPGIPGIRLRLIRALFDSSESLLSSISTTYAFSPWNRVPRHPLRIVCGVLRKEEIYAWFSKCVFSRKKITILGHIVPEERLLFDPKKTDTIATFHVPTCRKELICFLRLAGCYRRFIYDFARISRPLRDLAKQDTQWHWGMIRKNRSTILTSQFSIHLLWSCRDSLTLSS